MERRISQVSQSIVKIVAQRRYDDGTVHSAESACTGFFWSTDCGTSLITNWHNVTGLRADDHSKLGSFFPNVLQIRFLITHSREQDKFRVQRISHSVELYDENGPTWFEHPSQNKVDVVRIPLFEPTTAPPEVTCLNSFDFTNHWIVEAGADCFIVGYPEALEGGFETPIWKRGSIATEPSFDFKNQPVILVDTLSNKGMSGAPVIAEGHGFLGDKKGLSGNEIIGSWRKFLGIYSGREGESGVGFQLARVWKANCLDELLENGVQGRHPYL